MRKIEREATSGGDFQMALREQRQRVLAGLDEEKTLDATPIVRHDESLSCEEYLTLVYELHHVHLPELQSDGLVEFDRRADEVTRGARFEKKRPSLEPEDEKRTPLKRFVYSKTEMNRVGRLQEHMVGALEFDTVLDVCEHRHRRIVLAALTDQHQSLSTDDLANAIVEHTHHASPSEAADETVTRVRAGLHHVHLPRLAEAGLVQYDPERRVVEPTAQLDRAESHLSVILAVDSELPIRRES